MSTCLRPTRPPAQSNVGETLLKVKEKAEPELRDLLDEDTDGSLLVSIHIQDGVVNHIKVAVKQTFDFEALGVTPDGPKEPLDVRLGELLKSGLAMLRGRLQSSLVGGYHGYVVMQFCTRWQKCRMFTCEAEQVHRVQSGRVPV